jgi:hypothetical protein
VKKKKKEKEMKKKTEKGTATKRFQRIASHILLIAFCACWVFVFI